jgi:hypothetical protein
MSRRQETNREPRVDAQCSRISLGSCYRGRWGTGCGIGKSCGRSAGRLAAPATKSDSGGLRRLGETQRQWLIRGYSGTLIK